MAEFVTCPFDGHKCVRLDCIKAENKRTFANAACQTAALALINMVEGRIVLDELFNTRPNYAFFNKAIMDMGKSLEIEPQVYLNGVMEMARKIIEKRNNPDRDDENFKRPLFL